MQHATTDAPPLSIAAPKTREQASYEAIRGAIVAGRWRPGDQLAVSRIAQDLGISRVPVTNAVKRLASEGFLQLQPHQEPVVASLERESIREIYLMRAALEAVALSEAAIRVTPDEVTALYAHNERLRAARDSGHATIPELRAIDRDFHRVLHRLSAMPTLIQTLENFADRCEYYRVCLLPDASYRMFNPDRHLPILTALERHDAVTIGDLARQHILEGMAFIFAALDQTARGGADAPQNE